MSNVWLAVTLVSTFSAILLVGIGIDAFLSGERKRAVAMLRTHIGQPTGPIPNLRQEQLSKSAVTRLVLPAFGKTIGKLVRFTPLSLHKRIDRLIVLAGAPAAIDADRIVALKIILGVAGVVFGFVMGAFLPGGAIGVAGSVVLFGLLGYTLPSAYVSSMASRRQKEIRKSLSDTMDLLTISVEAGQGFDAALQHVMRNIPGPLSEEIGRMLQEMQIGVSRVDAFRHLSERTEVDELDGFVLSMIQAEMFGVSIANVLRAQSRELRHKRRQRAEEQAQKVPVKLLFPMIFMILPALFIVVLGPGAIKIYQQFFGGGLH